MMIADMDRLERAARVSMSGFQDRSTALAPFLPSIASPRRRRACCCSRAGGGLATGLIFPIEQPAGAKGTRHCAPTPPSRNF